MNKFFLIILVIIVISFTLVQAVSKDITITAAEVSPSVVEPGKDLTVKTRVYNPDNKEHKLSIELEESPFFILKSESQNLQKQFSLCAGCSRENNYYLTVKPEAISGIYPLTFKVIESGAGKTEDILIEIRGIPDIIISTTLDTGIAPGEQFLMNLTILNTGSTTAQNLKITPESNKFIVLGSGLKIFELLKPNETKSYNLKLYVNKNLESKAYTFPFTLTYKDDQGRSYLNTQEIGINVINKAELTLKNIELDPIMPQAGQPITIEGRLENVGEGNAEDVKVTLESELKGIKISYMGRLEKDDDGPIFFSGTIPTNGPKTDTLIITYKDDKGEYELTEEFSYVVGLNKKRNITLIIIALLAVGVLVIRNWMKKQKEKE